MKTAYFKNNTRCRLRFKGPSWDTKTLELELQHSLVDGTCLGSWDVGMKHEVHLLPWCEPSACLRMHNYLHRAAKSRLESKFLKMRTSSLDCLLMK